VHPVGRATADELTVVGMVFDLERRLQGAKLQHSSCFVPSYIGSVVPDVGQLSKSRTEVLPAVGPAYWFFDLSHCVPGVPSAGCADIG
jgi:hypothetical protein